MNTSQYLWPALVLSTTLDIFIVLQDMRRSLHKKNSLIFRSFVTIHKLESFPCHACCHGTCGRDVPTLFTCLEDQVS